MRDMEILLGKKITEAYDKEVLHAAAIANAEWNQINDLCSGSYVPEVFVLDASVSGSPFDPYRYSVLEQEVADDLWKCESCRKVYKISEHLECVGCGTSITEKSRFVLE